MCLVSEYSDSSCVCAIRKEAIDTRKKETKNYFKNPNNIQKKDIGRKWLLKEK